MLVNPAVALRVSSALLLPLGVAAQGRPDTAAFVTRLGADTLVLERFVRTAQRIDAEVVLRVPRTTRTRYVLELSSFGALVRMEALTFAASGIGEPLRRETIVREGDSLRVETVGRDETRTRMVAAEPATLPFIDMVHWPFELVLMRARASGSDAAAAMLTGSRVQGFPVAAVGRDSMTITHPLRGTMRVAVDALGRIQALDAGATTRKLVVQRRPWLDLDGPAAAWAAADSTGHGVGALSGRAELTATVAGATIRIDHGTPSRRGREIWGNLVPFGQVWRTGANQATGFTTDRVLVLGSGEDTLAVPAGAYTLFSIPERDGGVLIMNRQTGQAGTAYDPSRDLGRVALQARPLAEPAEVFTIAVTSDGAGGLLRLQWDRTELVVPFIVTP